VNRAVLIAALVLVAGVAVAVALVQDPGEKKPKSNLVAVLGPDPFTTGSPFKEPPVVESRNGNLKAEITAANGTLKVSGVDVAGGQAYAARSPSGVAGPAQMLGPTLHAEPGGTISIAFDNKLTVPDGMQSPEDCAAGGSHEEHGSSAPDAAKPQVTNFHFHGLRVTPKTRELRGVKVYGDNVLVDLPPGRSHIEFPIPEDHEQGTFWYHAHRHGCTDDQVSRGLAGLLFIGDSRRDLPARYAKVRTRDLMLQDIQVVDNPKGSGKNWGIDPAHFWGNPTHRMVNGQLNPSLDIAPGETQLWRIANGSAGVWFNVSLVDENDNPAGFTTVAQDGNTLEFSKEEAAHLLAPGNRIDILVTGAGSGKRMLKTIPFDQGNVTFPEDVLATVNAKGAPAVPIEAPGKLAPPPTLEPARGPDRQFTFNLVFKPSFGATINGQLFSLDQPPQATPTVNTTETWTVLNTSGEAHPFHIHQGDFVVKSVNGEPVDNLGQQDVVELPPMQGTTPGKVVFEMSFEEEGEFVFHCHILDHEDAGMMARVSVTDGR
jgi:suppressor of ftsI